MSDESDHLIEQAELAAWDQAKADHDEIDRRVDLLEQWIRETISAWKRGDIKTAHIQRGQLLLND